MHYRITKTYSLVLMI